MEQKQQFVSLAGSGHFTVTELCGQFEISRKTGQKWLSRHAEDGMKALVDRSRAPKSVTARATAEVERLICTILKIEALEEARTSWTKAAFRVLFHRQGLPEFSAIQA